MTKKESKRLTEAEYWEWRCTIEEMKTTRLNEKKLHLEREILNKEIENKKLKLALFRETLSSARSEVQKSQEEYENMKKRIEKRLGISLDNKAIDETTYEIKELENN